MRTIRCFVTSLVISLSLAGAAHAATVELYPAVDGGLYVVNSLDVALGAISVLVDGPTGFTPNPLNLGISLADTVYRLRPIDDFPWDALIINNYANGIAIAPAGATTLLGTFQGQGYNLITLLPGETEIPGLGPAFGFTLFDTNLVPIVASHIEFIGGCGLTICFSSGLRFTVPEPGTPSLALTALAASALLARVRVGRRNRARSSCGAAA